MRTTLASALILLLAAACSASRSSLADDATYPTPSPFVEAQIDQHLHDVPYLKGRQVVDACASLVRLGPAAIPRLKDAVADEDPVRRAFALNVLGAMGDRRVIETLREATRDPEPSVRYEAARSCMRLGEWSVLGVLVDGLQDESVYRRTLCHDALRKNTGVDFGFQPQAPTEERAAAVAKWRSWWSQHSKDTLAMRSE
ncbi:MAG: HEAT repeat domain-containing protein [Planctomycetes bacterium]|nr:HEAT repeat domain-containing protein [Planctomycetota bacterium]